MINNRKSEPRTEDSKWQNLMQWSLGGTCTTLKLRLRVQNHLKSASVYLPHCSGWIIGINTVDNLKLLHWTLKQEKFLCYPCTLAWNGPFPMELCSNTAKKNICCDRSFSEEKTRRLPCCVIHVTLLRVDVGRLWSGHYSSRALLFSTILAGLYYSLLF